MQQAKWAQDLKKSKPEIKEQFTIVRQFPPAQRMGGGMGTMNNGPLPPLSAMGTMSGSGATGAGVDGVIQPGKRAEFQVEEGEGVLSANAMQNFSPEEFNAFLKASEAGQIDKNLFRQSIGLPPIQSYAVGGIVGTTPLRPISDTGFKPSTAPSTMTTPSPLKPSSTPSPLPNTPSTTETRTLSSSPSIPMAPQKGLSPISAEPAPQTQIAAIKPISTETPNTPSPIQSAPSPVQSAPSTAAPTAQINPNTVEYMKTATPQAPLSAPAQAAAPYAAGKNEAFGTILAESRGESPVDQRIANNYLTNQDAVAATNIQAEINRISADPNMSEEAKNAAIAAVYRDFNAVRSGTIAQMVANYQEKASGAARDVFNLGSQAQTYEEITKPMNNLQMESMKLANEGTVLANKGKAYEFAYTLFKNGGDKTSVLKALQNAGMDLSSAEASFNTMQNRRNLEMTGGDMLKAGDFTGYNKLLQDNGLTPIDFTKVIEAENSKKYGEAAGILFNMVQAIPEGTNSFLVATLSNKAMDYLDKSVGNMTGEGSVFGLTGLGTANNGASVTSGNYSGYSYVKEDGKGAYVFKDGSGKEVTFTHEQVFSDPGLMGASLFGNLTSDPKDPYENENVRIFADHVSKSLLTWYDSDDGQTTILQLNNNTNWNNLVKQAQAGDETAWQTIGKVLAFAKENSENPAKQLDWTTETKTLMFQYGMYTPKAGEKFGVPVLDAIASGSAISVSDGVRKDIITELEAGNGAYTPLKVTNTDALNNWWSSGYDDGDGLSDAGVTWHTNNMGKIIKTANGLYLMVVAANNGRKDRGDQSYIEFQVVDPKTGALKERVILCADSYDGKTNTPVKSRASFSSPSWSAINALSPSSFTTK